MDARWIVIADEGLARIRRNLTLWFYPPPATAGPTG